MSSRTISCAEIAPREFQRSCFEEFQKKFVKNKCDSLIFYQRIRSSRLLKHRSVNGSTTGVMSHAVHCQLVPERVDRESRDPMDTAVCVEQRSSLPLDPV